MVEQDSRLRLKIGFAMAVAVCLLTLSVPALQWQFGVPALGFSLGDVEPGRGRVTAVEPGESAARAGLRVGDTLLAVGGIPISDTEAVDGFAEAVFYARVLNGHREGDPTQWIVVRDGQQRTLSVTLSGISDSTLISRAVVIGTFFLIACFLLWARPDRKHARHLAYTIFAITPSVLFLANRPMAVDSALGAIVHQVSLLGGFLGPALVIHFGIVFPHATLSAKVRRRVLAATYGVYFVAVYVVQQWIFLRAVGSPDAPYLLTPQWLQDLHYPQINLWLHVVNYLICGGFMLWSYRSLKAEREQDQVKWILWAVLFTAAFDVLGVGAALYVDGMGMSDLYPYRNYLYLLIAAGILISVFRHDLFDVDAVIRGTVIYFGTTTTLFLLFAVTEAVISETLEDILSTGFDNLSAVGAAVFAGALFQPLRSWLEGKMDSLLPVKREGREFAEG